MKDAIFQLCDQGRETSFALHRHLRHGHLEKIPENGLLHRLRKQSLEVFPQHPLSVFDEDGILLGPFSADLFVNGQLILELKAVARSSPITSRSSSVICAHLASNMAS